MSADPDTSDSTHRAPTTSQQSGSDTVSALFDRVLVVTSDDAAGRAAVEAGLDIASAHGATVDALYVVDTTEHWDVVVERHEQTGEATD